MIALAHTQTMGLLRTSVFSPPPSQKSCRALYALIDPDELFDGSFFFKLLCNSFKTPSVFCEYNLMEVSADTQ